MCARPKSLPSQLTIANELGCSQSLVSKVLNSQHVGIPDETIQRIWAHAKASNYRPRGINLDRFVAETVATRMVGFVLRSPLRLITEGPIFLHAHQGMHEYLLKRNIRTVYLGAEDELEASELARSVDRQKLVEGLAVMGEVKPAFMAGLASCRKPVVLVSARYPGVCHSVTSNLGQAASLLVEHLAGLGHRRFAWIGSRHGLGKMLHHKEAVLRCLASRNLQMAEGNVLDMPEADRRNGYAAARQIYESGRDLLPTAIICHNALLARGAINHLFQRGFSVPRDVSVVAMDLTQVRLEEPPEITGAAAPPEALGDEAARLILSRAGSEDRTVCEMTLPSRLDVRETTGRTSSAFVTAIRRADCA